MITSPPLTTVSIVTTLCGVNGTSFLTANNSATGPALQATNNGPNGGVIIDPGGSGNIYYSNYNRIYLLNASSNQVSVLVGAADHGCADGPASSATFSYLIGGIAVAPNGEFLGPYAVAHLSDEHFLEAFWKHRDPFA